jgi:hypothetical protein
VTGYLPSAFQASQQQPGGQNNQAPQLSQWVQVAAAQVPQILSTLNTAQAQPQAAALPPPNVRAHHAPPTKPATSNARPAQQAPILVDPQAVASPTLLEYPDSPAVCQLPGCEEYAHVDTNGEVSEYCSRAHRECVFVIFMVARGCEVDYSRCVETQWTKAWSTRVSNA